MKRVGFTCKEEFAHFSSFFGSLGFFLLFFLLIWNKYRRDVWFAEHENPKVHRNYDFLLSY